MKNLQWLKSIKAVTLDWGDTLSHVGGKDQKLFDLRNLQKANETYQLGLPFEALKNIVETLWSTYSLTFNSEATDWVDCNKGELLEPLLKANHISKAISNKIIDEIETQTSHILPFYHNLSEIFETFKKQGWKIGLLSHVNSRESIVKSVFEKNGFLRYFDFFSLSGDLKKVKPHPKHFEDAVHKSGFQPNQILHIGDHPLKDSCGANNAGFYNALIAEPHLYDVSSIRSAPADLFILSIFEMTAVLEEFEKNKDSTFYSTYPC